MATTVLLDVVIFTRDSSLPSEGVDKLTCWFTQMKILDKYWHFGNRWDWLDTENFIKNKYIQFYESHIRHLETT